MQFEQRYSVCVGAGGGVIGEKTRWLEQGSQGNVIYVFRFVITPIFSRFTLFNPFTRMDNKLILVPYLFFGSLTCSKSQSGSSKYCVYMMMWVRVGASSAP